MGSRITSEFLILRLDREPRFFDKYTRDNGMLHRIWDPLVGKCMLVRIPQQYVDVKFFFAEIGGNRFSIIGWGTIPRPEIYKGPGHGYMFDAYQSDLVTYLDSRGWDYTFRGINA